MTTTTSCSRNTLSNHERILACAELLKHRNPLESGAMTVEQAHIELSRKLNFVMTKTNVQSCIKSLGFKLPRGGARTTKKQSTDNFTPMWRKLDALEKKLDTIIDHLTSPEPRNG